MYLITSIAQFLMPLVNLTISKNLIVGLVHPFRHYSRSTRRARFYILPVATFAFILVIPDILKYIIVNDTVSWPFLIN